MTMTVRDDITCPKDGDPILLDKFSIAKWSEALYLIHCPRCKTFHGFTPTASDGEALTTEDNGNGR